jgi:flavodoxin
MTRVLLVCQSVSHGNTRKVADAMAEVLNAEVRAPADVDPERVGSYDLVGFGSGVFGFAPHPELATFVDGLPPAHGARAFVFATSGLGRILSRPFSTPLAARLSAKGFRVVGSFCCRGFDTWLPLRLIGGINKGHPNDADLEHARKFAHSVAAAPNGSSGQPR